MRLLIVSLFGTAALLADTCADKCAAPVIKNATRVYRFDASKTNQTYSDQLEDNETVALVVENKNPFKYEYKITKDVRNLTLDIISGFMAGFPSLTLPNLNKSISSPGGSTFDNAEPPVKAAWTKVTDKIKELNQLIQDAQGDLKSKQAAEDKYNAFLDLTKDDILDGCDIACAKAQELSPLIKQISDTKDARARQAKIEKAITALDDLLKTVNDTIDKSTEKPDDKQGQKKEASDTVAEAKKTAQSVLDDYKKALDEIDGKKNAIGRLATVLQGGSWTFWEVQTETSAGSSRNVRWTIYRRNLRVDGAGWEQLGVVSLDLGSAPVSVSVGALVSTVAFDKFVRQSGSDGKGG